MGVALGAHPLGDHARAEWDMKVAAAKAVILFEPDGYVLSGEKLMGRQAAGNAFLRAAVARRQGQPNVQIGR
jgi:hypothetical protein